MKGELPIPLAASQNESAVELLRVWAAGGAQHVSIAAKVWQDPAAWGIFMVDLAKHLANAYCAEGSNDKTAILQRIKAGLDAEWHHATGDPTGGLKPETR
jgi:hypothetical protein